MCVEIQKEKVIIACLNKTYLQINKSIVVILKLNILNLKQICTFLSNFCNENQSLFSYKLLYN